MALQTWNKSTSGSFPFHLITTIPSFPSSSSLPQDDFELQWLHLHVKLLCWSRQLWRLLLHLLSFETQMILCAKSTDWDLTYKEICLKEEITIKSRLCVSLFDGFVTNVPCPNEEIVSRVWASSVTWFLYFCLSGSLLLLELLRLSRNALHLIHPRIGSWGGDTSTGTDNDLTRWIRAGIEGRSELSEVRTEQPRLVFEEKKLLGRIVATCCNHRSPHVRKLILPILRLLCISSSFYF